MKILRRLLAWTRRGRLDTELRDELAQHLAWKTEQLLAEGLPEAEARRRAAIEIGNVTRLREDTHDEWGFPRLESVLQDARYGLRQMRRAPMFTAIAVLSLTIGIGASAAVFSLADALMLRRLPVRDPGSLVVLKWTSGPVMPFSSLNGQGEQNVSGLASTSFAMVAFDEMRAATSGQMDLIGYADLYDVSVAADGRAEVANAHTVSGNYFDVLGIGAAAGRLLAAADDDPNASPAAVLTEGYWRRRFGRSEEVIGRQITVNGISFTVTGVTAPGFAGTGQVGDAPDVFIPLATRGRVLRGEESEADPAYWWVLMVGRLRNGVTAAQMQPTLDGVLKRTVAASKPALAAGDLPTMHLLDGSRGQVETRTGLRDPLKTMAVVVTIVLLVACANVANLLLARGRARARELSVRTAIGAARGRVIRQLFTEGALLALTGAMLGLVAARWISAALMPALILSPGATVPGLDWRVLGFVIVLAATCAIAFALAPAIRSSRVTLTAGLREASARGPRRVRLAGSLVVVQLALSMVLVVTAALLARSLWNLDRVPLGFDTSNLLVFKIDPTLNGYAPDRVRSLASGILDQLRAVPGVTGATFTSHRLLANNSAIGVAANESESAPEPGSREAPAFIRSHSAWRLVTGSDFFPTLRIPIVRGRPFDDRDAANAPKVAVINRTLAQRLFQTDDAVGRRFRLGIRSTSPLYEVVGVAGDARYASVRDDVPPTVYLAAAQQPLSTMTFEVRTAGDAAAVAGAAREAVRRVDDQVPLMGVRTMTDQVAESMRQERLFTRLAVLLGGVALALSAIGLYGLLAYGVALRVPEIGLRMALGAQPGEVRWMILKQSLGLAAIGLAAGAAGSLAGTRLVDTMLYQLPSRDPLTIAGAAVIMLVTCVLAGYLPARRAACVDPMVALRTD